MRIFIPTTLAILLLYFCAVDCDFDDDHGLGLFKRSKYGKRGRTTKHNKREKVTKGGGRKKEDSFNEAIGGGFKFDFEKIFISVNQGLNNVKIFPKIRVKVGTTRGEEAEISTASVEDTVSVTTLPPGKTDSPSTQTTTDEDEEISTNNTWLKEFRF